MPFWIWDARANGPKRGRGGAMHNQISWRFAGYASCIVWSCYDSAVRGPRRREAERACEWCNGASFYQLAELHRLRGKFAEAELAYRRATEYGQALEPGLPLLWLAQGQRGAAQAAIRRAVGEPQPPHRRAAILAACVEIMIDGSELQAARRERIDRNDGGF